jgi:hypothetical protein
VKSLPRPIEEFRFTDLQEASSVSSCSAAIDSMACLRTAGVNVSQTVNLNINAAAFDGTFAFVPVVDGEFIRQRPTISLAQCKVNGVSLSFVPFAGD